MSDLISRQALCEYALNQKDKSITPNDIMRFPSAQPELCGDAVSRNFIVQKLNKMDRYVSTELRLCDTDEIFPQNEVFIVDDVYEEIVEQLPPAQPQEVHINLNESIKVKLTELSKKIFYHQYDAINKIIGREVCKPSFPKEDENGYTKFQLWEFIELYGMHIGMTLPNVIEPLEIVCDARREERREE